MIFDIQVTESRLRLLQHTSPTERKKSLSLTEGLLPVGRIHVLRWMARMRRSRCSRSLLRHAIATSRRRYARQPGRPWQGATAAKADGTGGRRWATRSHDCGLFGSCQEPGQDAQAGSPLRFVTASLATTRQFFHSA